MDKIFMSKSELLLLLPLSIGHNIAAMMSRVGGMFGMMSFIRHNQLIQKGLDGRCLICKHNLQC